MPAAAKSKALRSTSIARGGYGQVLRSMVSLLDEARRTSARAVNVVMTATYWEMGRRIVELDQSGASRAAYGKELLARLAQDLGTRYGRGFSHRNLNLMRSFYLGWNISQTVSAKSLAAPSGNISQTLSAKSQSRYEASDSMASLEVLSRVFKLPWSHYVRLLTVDDEHARRFYETEALRGGWSVRQLDRQISTRFFERTARSRNKIAMLEKGGRSIPADLVTVDEAIRDSFILEFLNLKDEYSESDLEDALISGMEHFLMELGGDFAFVGRQRRLRIGKEWYRVDLLFFHRKLKCLVIVYLKLGRFTHKDSGQMILYLNYAEEHWANAGENPPVGLILCTEKDDAVAHYALGGVKDRVLAREYRLALPDVKKLEAAVERARRMLEQRGIERKRINRIR